MSATAFSPWSATGRAVMASRAIRALVLAVLCLVTQFGMAQQGQSAPSAVDDPAVAVASGAPSPPAQPGDISGSVEAVENLSVHFSGWIRQLTGEWGQISLLGVEAWRFAAFFALLFLTLLSAQITRVAIEKYAMKLALRTKWKTDDMIVANAGKPALLCVTGLGLYISALPLLLIFDPLLRLVFGRLCLAVAAAAMFWYFYRVVDVLDHHMRKLAGRTDNDFDDTFVDVIRKTLRTGLVIIGGLFIGQAVLKINITTLLASAGIIGLAIAFAARDTIANIFGTMMLLIDKPFRTAERVVVDGADGAVESIGVRSTRIRTLAGHLVSIPNKEVANTKVENIGRRPHIKRVSNLTITYDTPVDKVEKALQIVRGVLADHEGMDPDLPPRVHFNEFNDWALNILMIAWYHPAEYWDYLAWCERTNLAIMRAFEQEGIEFAFPTTTTYLAQDDRRPLAIAARVDR